MTSLIPPTQVRKAEKMEALTRGPIQGFSIVPGDNLFWGICLEQWTNGILQFQQFFPDTISERKCWNCSIPFVQDSTKADSPNKLPGKVSLDIHISRISSPPTLVAFYFVIVTLPSLAFHYNINIIYIAFFYYNIPGYATNKKESAPPAGVLYLPLFDRTR